MGHITYEDALLYLEPLACLGALILMFRRSQIRQYLCLAALLATRLVSDAICIPVLHMGGRQLTALSAYKIYFYTYWSSYVVEAVLGFLLIASLYRLAMVPLPGLRRLGKMMFQLAACLGVVIAVTLAFSPHLSGQPFFTNFFMQLQRVQSVITLCMLLFVCLVAGPLGLSFRSKIVGISLGLGVMATADLVGSAWLADKKSMASVYDIMNGLAILAALSIWSAYFAMPEPKRRMIILPTTSPFLRWNQIAEVLGDEPGYVALGEVTDDMFDPSEVEIMHRASLKMAGNIPGML